MKAGLVQLNASDDPVANLDVTLGYLGAAEDQGAAFVLTPEVTNCVSKDRARQSAVLQYEAEDQTLAAIRAFAASRGIWVLIGSLALKEHGEDRFVNRSFLIAPGGDIAARYDKIHMFDVQISADETYRESSGYRPGEQAVVAQTPFARIGMEICYDMRFPLLSNALAQAGAEVLTYPSAFSPMTGKAHWHALLRARAIENGAWVLAPAQTGTHAAQSGVPRKTYGHSLVVSPWGDVTLDAGDLPGVYMFDLDMTQTAEARRRIPSLDNARHFDGP